MQQNLATTREKHGAFSHRSSDRYSMTETFWSTGYTYMSNIDQINKLVTGKYNSILLERKRSLPKS